MADPVIAVATYAETRGFLSFATYEKSKQWSAGARIRLRAARRDMDTRAREVEANRLFAELSIAGISVDAARREARVSQQRFIAALKPWVKEQLQSHAADDLDLVASWYIMYQPELLQRLGVDFGTIEPISQ